MAVIFYRRFWTIYRFHHQGSRIHTKRKRFLNPDYGTDRLSRNAVNIPSTRCVITQKSAVFFLPVCLSNSLVFLCEMVSLFLSQSKLGGRFLYNKNQQTHLFPNFILVRNSTCFGLLLPILRSYPLYIRHWHVFIPV